jgi:hypothetical protein
MLMTGQAISRISLQVQGEIVLQFGNSYRSVNAKLTSLETPLLLWLIVTILYINRTYSRNVTLPTPELYPMPGVFHT